MNATRPSPVLVIGLGNECRGDDAVGRLVARRLRSELSDPSTRILEQNGEGLALMESWAGAALVILVDAVCADRRTRPIHRFEPCRDPLPAQRFLSSTHAFGLAEAIELARAINRLPPRLIVYGIESRRFESGSEIASEVLAAAEQVKERIKVDIGRFKKRAPSRHE